MANSTRSLDFVLAWALRWGFTMPSPLHQRILDLLRAKPQLVLELLAIVEPDRRELWLDRRWLVRVGDPNLRARGMNDEDVDRIADLVILLFPEDMPDKKPTIVIVVECQLGPDPDKFFSWGEYLTAARREHRCAARLMVLSPVDTVIEWAKELFLEEPWLTPRLVGRSQIPRIDDHGRALREPELAILSAVFHGRHEGGEHVVSAAALALCALPRHKRCDYLRMFEELLPEELMTEVRRVSFEEAQKASEEWLRGGAAYQIGHREGLAAGREVGCEVGLVRGRREALEWILELRGLAPSADELTRIRECTDLPTLEHWCARAKTAARVTELFD